jgi:collagenase-like PrtC family protease
MRLFTVPALSSKNILQKYQELNARHEGAAKIIEIYGSHPNNAFGSGRAALILPRFTESEFAQHVGTARRLGFSFSYLLNAACMGGAEGTYEGQRQLRRLLTYLVDVGVDKVTITSPMVMEFVREHRPELAIGVSVISYVDTIDKLLFFERLGARRVALDIDVTRNFPLIRAMRRATEIELALIVNSLCRISCPLKTFHYNVNAHFSQTGRFLDDDGRSIVEATTLQYVGARCLMERHAEKAEILKTALVRPEDLGYYSEAGIDVFKIQGRGTQPDNLLRTIDMYMSGRTAQRYAPLSLFAAGLSGFTIDSEAMNGFMAFFAENGYRCAEGCDRCRWCDEWAERAVHEETDTVSTVREGSAKMLAESLAFDQHVDRIADALLSAACDAVPEREDVFDA